MIAEGAAGSWGGVYLHQVMRASHWFAMAVFAAFSLAMAVGRLAGDRLASRYGPARLVRGGGLLAAAGLAGALAGHRPALAVLGFAVCGGGLSCTVPQLLSVASRIDPARSGGCIARVAGLGYLGLVGGPVLIGGCASLAGLPTALCIPVLLGVCVAIFGYLLERPLARPVPGVTGMVPAPPAGSRSR